MLNITKNSRAVLYLSLKGKTINIIRREEKSSAVTKSQERGKVGPDYPLNEH